MALDAALETLSHLGLDNLPEEHLLMHNHVLDVRETRQLFAEYMDMEGKEHIVNFGGFSAELRMRGGFPSANAPFDPKRNTVGVDLLPGPCVKGAVKALKPIDVTFDEKDRIYHAFRLSPFEAYDVVARDGERFVEVSGTAVKVHAEAGDEGIWIENDAGGKNSGFSFYTTSRISLLTANGKF